MKFNKKEMSEVYNALCCLNIAIRDNHKERKRTAFVRKLIKRVVKEENKAIESHRARDNRADVDRLGQNFKVNLKLRTLVEMTGKQVEELIMLLLKDSFENGRVEAI